MSKTNQQIRRIVQLREHHVYCDCKECRLILKYVDLALQKKDEDVKEIKKLVKKEIDRRSRLSGHNPQKIYGDIIGSLRSIEKAFEN